MNEREKLYALYMAARMQDFYDTDALGMASYDAARDVVIVKGFRCRVTSEADETRATLNAMGFNDREIVEAQTFVGMNSK